MVEIDLRILFGVLLVVYLLGAATMLGIDIIIEKKNRRRL